MESKQKSSGKLKNFIVFVLIMVIFGGGGYYFYKTHQEELTYQGGVDYKKAVKITYYEEEKDELYTDDISGFTPDRDVYWLKFKAPNSMPRYIGAFIHSASGKMYKGGAVYDSTRKNKLADMHYNESEDRYDSDPFNTEEGKTYYIKIKLGKHTRSDSIFTTVMVYWDWT